MWRKSVPVAYILWFFLGILGVHQFYLRRNHHAFFLWATLGGIAGIGWLRDLFYIPTYVAAANESEEYMSELNELKSKKKVPDQGVCRWAASVALGYIFAILMYAVLWSDHLNERYVNTIIVLAHTFGALGVYIPNNEGHKAVSLGWCILGAYATLPLTIMYGEDYLFYGPLVSSSVASYKMYWKNEQSTQGFCIRALYVLAISIIYLGLLSTAIYYNATITTKGETVPLREAVQNFFNSKAWKETKETLSQLYNYYTHHGWRALWEEFLTAFDPQGEAHAYEVLGLNKSVTLKELKATYKSLALKYHPDKEKQEAKKKEMADKFMEIQKAYDILLKLKKERTQKQEL